MIKRCISPKPRPKKSFAKKVPSAADDRRYKEEKSVAGFLHSIVCG